MQTDGESVYIPKPIHRPARPACALGAEHRTGTHDDVERLKGHQRMQAEELLGHERRQLRGVRTNGVSRLGHRSVSLGFGQPVPCLVVS